ncbi:MAG: hypothetical protein SGJ18_12630 [Pseudomonadota bacterium]|nr:hypothetical protein [Pseudomonadota bacterium]
MKILLTLCCFLSLQAFGAEKDLTEWSDGIYNNPQEINDLLRSADKTCTIKFLSNEITKSQIEKGSSITEVTLKKESEGAWITLKFDVFRSKEGTVYIDKGFKSACVKRSSIIGDAAETNIPNLILALNSGLLNSPWNQPEVLGGPHRTEAKQLANVTNTTPVTLVSSDSEDRYNHQIDVNKPSAL